MIRVFIRTFINPFSEFVNDSRAIGISLLVSTILSLIIANSLGGIHYTAFWNTAIDIDFASIHLPHTLVHWINDGLMTLFFLLAGMEIKRELLHGELSTTKQALLPAAAALGGMLFPALIYLLFNYHNAFVGGWGIPTATDIAFSLGIASLLGKKVPLSLKIFLTALAIIDDLGAIVVIALFYGEAVHWFYIFLAIFTTFTIYFTNILTRKFGFIQILLGILLWYFTYNSGIHPTISGVVFAFLVPVRYLVKYENNIHHPVYFIILPLFALANTAIIFPEAGIAVLKNSMPVGIMLALSIGKPIGITTACWLMIKMKKADLPVNTSWNQMIGAGLLAGIGFTMSIFIATLAFNTATAIDTAKIAVLFSSFFSMIAGYLWLYFSYKPLLINSA